MPAIETTDLTKRYGTDVLAVQDLDLTVHEGEVFGFLGPNGAGKSTTIDMLLDYVRPTAGSASVLGFDAQRETQRIHERVGILPDGYGLYDRLAGRKHLEFAIDLKGASDDPDDILDRVGLDVSAAERPAGDYSAGMRQRLALGMALVGDPDLLVLDEPTNGLDPHGIREMRSLIRAEADRGKTVFFSSHILSQVEAVCDRVGIMNDGRLVAVDTIDGLRDAVGTGSLLELRVDRSVDDATLDGIDGVSDVAVEDHTVRATVTEPTAKAVVVNRVEETGATVLDITTRESTLEDLFTVYTEEVEA
ncbi:ABC transporter ATP-binding protein [Halobacteriaceae archaeon GCM10025711]